MSPFDIQNENEFKRRYRFSAENVRYIIDLITPYLEIPEGNRGLPATVEQIVGVSLEMMGAGHFFRCAGYSNGFSTSSCWRYLYKFRDALLHPNVCAKHLHLPTFEQQQENIAAVYQKYKLYNVIGAIDGCHFPFLEQPRNLPPGRSAENFFNRKGDYSINGQIFGGMDCRIYDINLSASGSFHDAV